MFGLPGNEVELLDEDDSTWGVSVHTRARDPFAEGALCTSASKADVCVTAGSALETALMDPTADGSRCGNGSSGSASNSLRWDSR